MPQSHTMTVVYSVLHARLLCLPSFSKPFCCLCFPSLDLRHCHALQNTYTGTLYKNDNTIFAWDLMNEVRCECFPASLYPAFPTNAECLPSCADSLDVSPSSMCT